MVPKQQELLVGLSERMRRVGAHWALVDAVLPPSFPLVLLNNTGRMEFEALLEGFPALRAAVSARRQEAVLARAAYQELLQQMHRRILLLNGWVRAFLAQTRWEGVLPRVPGRTETFEKWREAAFDLVLLWRGLAAAPPPPPAWPVNVGDGLDLAQFEAEFAAFEASRRALRAAELELRLAQGEWRTAQRTATALLMAYGHVARGRLGEESELTERIPKVWPQRGESAP